MSRVNKYRGWWRHRDGSAADLIEDINDRPISDLNESHFIIEQFTGLCDKSGKEIFEGDIYFDEGISYWGSHCVGPYKNYRVIEYNTERAQFVARHHCGHENIDTTKEIIGNIHETPELLK